MQKRQTNYLINEKQAARMLNLKVQTLRNWRFLCKGPDYHKLGRSVKYDESSLLRYIESRKIKVS